MVDKGNDEENGYVFIRLTRTNWGKVHHPSKFLPKRFHKKIIEFDL
jgi:hypothetical protein